MNKITIEGMTNIDYSKNAVYPLKIRGLLDKSLDQSTLTLRNLEQEKPFEPLTKVKIYNKTGIETINPTFTFLIANDEVKRDLYGSEARYTHNLLLIEETKELEKYFVDTCTFTNSLAKKYDLTEHYRTPVEMTAEEIDKYWEEYKEKTGTGTPEETGYTAEIDNSLGGTPNDDMYKTINSYTSTSRLLMSMASAYFSTTGEVTTSGDTYMCMRLYDGDYNLVKSYMGQSLTDKSELISPGSYNIEYVVLKSYYFGIAGRRYDCYGIKYSNIAYVSNITPLPNITITDVVNRLLAITETQRVGATPKFVFNSAQATYYSNVLAPEFAITKSTLREALQQVGSYIHAEPRLQGNTIYFDDLGSREKALIPENYVSSTSMQDIEQFCSEIDSNIDNMVNIDDEQAGTIVEPFTNGWKTTRVELGTIDVKDDNAFIETTKPIEKIVKVEFGYLYGESDSDADFSFKDITPYIFENAEYSILDSYNGAYPYSKAFALYYTQGQKNIYGLQYEQPDAISPFLKKMAIINILETVTNTTINTLDNPLAKMQFRVTYIPVVNMRVKQHKAYLGATKKKSVLAYNASANKVDTDYYGENLKGAVARLGNIEKTITYCCKELSDIPKAGTLFDRDYYISAVTIECLPNYYRFTLGLSKDFNRWNEYVGINNNQRFYEVSEKQAVERYVVYEDYLIIGDDVNLETNEYEKSIVDEGIFETFINNMKPTIDGYSRAITSIAFSGYDGNNNLISTITMPATSFALGNSVIYQISMSDSFGAGTYIQQWLTNAKGTQIQKEYGDIYGNIETIKVEGYAEPILVKPDDYDTAVQQGASVPAIIPTNTIKEFSTGSYNIILKKDSRENINFAYQIHCVTNRENIVIGSGLAKKLSTKNIYALTMEDFDPDYGDMYIMDREIMKFEKEITDLPNSSYRINYSIDRYDGTMAYNKTITFDTITCNKDGKSIIIVDRKTNELIFAINDTFVNGQTYIMPKMMFRHKIYN